MLTVSGVSLRVAQFHKDNITRFLKIILENFTTKGGRIRDPEKIHPRSVSRG
jgi:hypothetical protein